MAPIIPLKKIRRDDDDLRLFPEAELFGQSASDREEGRLSVDAYETDMEIIIISPIAGVKPEDLEVFVHNDMLTIRGQRAPNCVETGGPRKLVSECHWGAFSRSLILPAEVDTEAITAELKDGILTVRLPKAERSHRIKIAEK